MSGRSESHPPPGSDESAVHRDPAAMVAAGVLAAHVLTLLAFGAYYLVRLARHDVANVGGVVESVGLLLVVAVLLALLARAMLVGRSWARTPTVVWLLLLVPVAVGMFQSGRPDLGAVVLLLSVAGIGGVIRARSDPQD